MWKGIKNNVRNRLVSGTLLLIPFGVTLLVMRWLYGLVAHLLEPVVKGALGGLARFPLLASIPQVYVSTLVLILTVIALVFLLYLIGAIGQYVVGKKLITTTELLLGRIPLVRSIYSATKQVITAISRSGQDAFISVVLVEFPRPGFKAIGFLTGYIKDATGRKYCKVLIPTTPNPTTGFFEIVPTEDVSETAMTIEEAFKMIISGGIVSPDVLLLRGEPRVEQSQVRSP